MTDTTTHCHNCGAAVQYHYCAVCGQETKLHVPSAGEFLHEFVGHYVAFEGKLWQTLLMLLFKPGRLTVDYLAGRRARYVQPLRLYLTFSLVFFALLKFSGIELVKFDDKDFQKEAQVAPAGAPKPVISVQAMGKDQPAWAEKVNHFGMLSNTERGRIISDAFFSYGPYALFCLLPAFALWLKLLYLGSRRRYGEHLLFALHTNAFAFAMLILTALSPWGVVKFLFGLWMVVYLPIAMRRVYAGALWSTWLRWAVLMSLHLISMALVMVAAFALAITK